MRRFARGDIPASVATSRYGTMRDFAVWMFRAHRAVAEVGLEAMKPARGHVTISFRTDPPERYAEALFYVARYIDERCPVNCSVHYAQLSPTGQAGEQMGLLSGG